MVGEVLYRGDFLFKGYLNKKLNGGIFNNNYFLIRSMKKSKENVRLYVSPQCRIVRVDSMQFFCVSVLPDSSSSTSPSSTEYYSGGGWYDVGTIRIGDASTVAPAKQNVFCDDGED